MNSKTVQKLVINYKNTDSSCKKARNLLFLQILNEYNLILHKLIRGMPDKDEAYSIAVCELLKAIDSYDPFKKVSFNTYVYYFFKGISRIYNKNIMPLTEDEVLIDTVKLTDLALDIDKVLNPKELLILKAYINGTLKTKGKPKLVGTIDQIHTKLKKYIAGN